MLNRGCLCIAPKGAFTYDFPIFYRYIAPKGASICNFSIFYRYTAPKGAFTWDFPIFYRYTAPKGALFEPLARVIYLFSNFLLPPFPPADFVFLTIVAIAVPIAISVAVTIGTTGFDAIVDQGEGRHLFLLG